MELAEAKKLKAAVITASPTVVSIASSFGLYFEGRKAPLQFQEGEYVGVPCAVARFPKEAPFPPREWVERGFNVAEFLTDLEQEPLFLRVAIKDIA